MPQNWLRGTRALRQGVLEHGLHRGLDILASLTLLVLTLPLLLVVALAHQARFTRADFLQPGARRPSSPEFLHLQVAVHDGSTQKQPGAAVWAKVGDSRVTRMGRLIRLTRIDEIPQAINILRGDMAFVGPRPERPVFVAELTAADPAIGRPGRGAPRPDWVGAGQVSPPPPYGASIEDAPGQALLRPVVYPGAQPVA